MSNSAIQMATVLSNSAAAEYKVAKPNQVEQLSIVAEAQAKLSKASKHYSAILVVRPADCCQAYIYVYKGKVSYNKTT